MKRKYVYELQYLHDTSNRWRKSSYEKGNWSIVGRILFATYWNRLSMWFNYRVVQKLGRKIVKVIYPKVRK